jgi:hypothetical protein
MKLSLKLLPQDDYDIRILSIASNSDLGLIQPNETKEFTLKVFALQTGLKRVGGLHLINKTGGENELPPVLKYQSLNTF